MNVGGYRTSGTFNIFPMQFLETPSLILLDTSSTGISNGCRSSSVNSANFNAFWWGINSNAVAMTYSVSYVAIGKWK